MFPSKIQFLGEFPWKKSMIHMLRLRMFTMKTGMKGEDIMKITHPYFGIWLHRLGQFPWKCEVWNQPQWADMFDGMSSFIFHYLVMLMRKYVQLDVYLYIIIYIHIYIYIYIHIDIYIYIYICVYLPKSTVYIYTYMCVLIYIYILICINTYNYNLYIHTYIEICVYIYIYFIHIYSGQF